MGRQGDSQISANLVVCLSHLSSLRVLRVSVVKQLRYDYVLMFVLIQLGNEWIEC
jgi:hypothetical protein